MWSHHIAEFQLRYTGLVGVLETFWAGVSEADPRLQPHPVFGVANWRRRAIPMGVHGDGVPYGRDE
eukprot:6610319-Lingulodinium_polyedra.AAC.1